MTRSTITPQLLQDLLDTHAIGADVHAGLRTVYDRSLDADHTEVRITGVYDLSAVADELNTLDNHPDGEAGRGGRDRGFLVTILVAIIIILVAILTIEHQR